MADENQAGPAVDEQGQPAPAPAPTAQEPGEEPEFDYPVRIEDAGPGAKRLHVEIPRQRIDQKIAQKLTELRREAPIPGFRTGHAPQRLVEKRFGHDVRETVRSELIGESYEQALKRNNLQVLGDPEFDNPDAIRIPDEGPLTYSVQIEVQPQVTLPDMAALTIRRPKMAVSDAHVEQALTNVREQQGSLMPVEDRGLQAGDRLVADVHVRLEGQVVAHQVAAELVAGSANIAGIEIADLAERLVGLRPGETRSFSTPVPATHANEAWRGKEVQIEVALTDLRRLELAELDAPFLDNLGFGSVDELRQMLRIELERRLAGQSARAMREQVISYLLQNVAMDLPQKLSQKQTERLVSRRMLELRRRGLSPQAIEANIERIRSGADEAAQRELKLFFILQKAAEDSKIDVSEGELNAEIATMAADEERRPERLKQDMAKDGRLLQLYLMLREQKTLDYLVGQARVEDLEVPATAPLPSP